MSDLASKLERPASTSDTKARCTLAQLRDRWGVTERKHAPGEADLLPRVGDEVVHRGMGEPETWRVVSVVGTKAENVQLERVDD